MLRARNTTMRHHVALPLLLALVAGPLATPCLAQVPPLRLALELNPARSVRGERDLAQSVARQVAAHLVPQLEAQGWQVTRVYSARKAAKGGRFHASLRLDIDAKRVFHVTDARVYEHGIEKSLITEHSSSVTTWGDWVAWDGMTGRVLADGDIDPIEPLVQTAGGGRPELDDEESMARLIADAAKNAVGDVLAASRAALP